MKTNTRNIFTIFLGIGAIFLAACGGGSDPVVEPGPVTEPVPAEFAAVYDELSTNLSQRESELRAEWDGTRAPLGFGTSLITVDSNAGAALFDPAVREGNRLYLQRLVELGIQAVAIQINYPLLTSNFTADAPDYLATYAEIADEVRAHGLKLIVEHNSLLSGFSALDPASYYASLTKTQYGDESYVEIRAIIEQIKPDYLSLVAEPQTFSFAMGLDMSVSDWGIFVEGVITQLAIDVPNHATKLGAGSGAWEDPAFVESFANIPGIDYIDIHSYPLINNVTDYLKNLVAWPEKIRATHPDMEFISSESWLYKAQVSELGRAPIDAALLLRDVYSFWAPLDKQFMEVLSISAYKGGYSVIAPFWSNYFFAYLDYADPALAGLSVEELRERGYSAAFQAVQAGQTTELGRAYSRLINP